MLIKIFTDINVYIIDDNYLSIHFKKLGKEQKINSKKIKGKIIKIRNTGIKNNTIKIK